MRQKDSIYLRLTRALTVIVWLLAAALIGAARPWEKTSVLKESEFYVTILQALIPWAAAWGVVIGYYWWRDKRYQRKSQRFNSEFLNESDVHNNNKEV